MSARRIDVKRADHSAGQFGRTVQRTGCMWLLLKWLGSAAAIWVAAWLLGPHVQVDSFRWALVVAVVLGLLNALVRPVLILLTLPITVLTLGLFLIVINALMLQLAGWLLEGFEIEHFGWAALAALVIAGINLVLDAFLEGLASRSGRS